MWPACSFYFTSWRHQTCALLASDDAISVVLTSREDLFRAIWLQPCLVHESFGYIASRAPAVLYPAAAGPEAGRAAAAGAAAVAGAQLQSHRGGGDAAAAAQHRPAAQPRRLCPRRCVKCLLFQASHKGRSLLLLQTRRRGTLRNLHICPRNMSPCDAAGSLTQPGDGGELWEQLRALQALFTSFMEVIISQMAGCAHGGFSPASFQQCPSNACSKYQVPCCQRVAKVHAVFSDRSPTFSGASAFLPFAAYCSCRSPFTVQ